MSVLTLRTADHTLDPMASSMAALINDTDPSREQLQDYLDVEVSHGFVLGGNCPWEIQFSTMPFKQGQPLEFANEIAVDPQTGELSAKNPQPSEIWSFPINSLGIEDLLVLFPPCK